MEGSSWLEIPIPNSVTTFYIGMRVFDVATKMFVGEMPGYDMYTWLHASNDDNDDDDD